MKFKIFQISESQIPSRVKEIEELAEWSLGYITGKSNWSAMKHNEEGKLEPSVWERGLEIDWALTFQGSRRIAEKSNLSDGLRIFEASALALFIYFRRQFYFFPLCYILTGFIFELLLFEGVRSLLSLPASLSLTVSPLSSFSVALSQGLASPRAFFLSSLFVLPSLVPAGQRQRVKLPSSNSSNWFSIKKNINESFLTIIG